MCASLSNALNLFFRPLKGKKVWGNIKKIKADYNKISIKAAESHLMIAEAAIKGIGSDANVHYQKGIEHSMRMWGVDGADISTFL